MKKEQSYKNHKRFDPIYHYLMLPLSVTILGLSVYLALEKDLIEGLYYMLTGLLLSLGILKIRAYAKVLQNRLVRAEMRIRYQEVTGNSFQEVEKQLNFGQMIALRFAGDEELEELTKKSAEEKLTPKQIKERIQDWQGDFYRV